MNKNTHPKTLAKVHCAHNSAVGVDVSAQELVCCFQRYVPESGELLAEYSRFKTVGDNLAKFAQWCRERSPDIVLMESTGVYWLSPYTALEFIGMGQSRIAVVKADRVEGPKGRKTDEGDSIRLAEFARIGAYQATYIPPADFRYARQVGRVFHRAKKDAAIATNRLHKAFSAMGCRLSMVFSDIKGKTATEIIDAFLNGSPEDFERTVRHARKLKATADEIIAAFHAEIDEPKKAFLNSLKEEVERREAWANQCFQRLEDTLAPYQPLIALLTSIPGVQRVSAFKILSEPGPNLDAFPDSKHFCSWIGICPGNNESAGKRGSGRIPKGNAYLKTYLIEVGQAVGLMKKNAAELRKFFQSVKERRGHKRAVVAVAHKIARIIYALLTNGAIYEGVADHTLLKGRRARLERAARGLRELGEEVEISVGSASSAEADNGGNARDRDGGTRMVTVVRPPEDPVPKSV